MKLIEISSYKLPFRIDYFWRKLMKFGHASQMLCPYDMYDTRIGEVSNLEDFFFFCFLHNFDMVSTQC